eukprot:386877_1
MAQQNAPLQQSYSSSIPEQTATSYPSTSSTDFPILQQPTFNKISESGRNDSYDSLGGNDNIQSPPPLQQTAFSLTPQGPPTTKGALAFDQGPITASFQWQ